MSLLASLRSLGSHLSCPGGPLSLRAGIGQALGPAAAQMFVRGMKVRSAIKKRCEATLKTCSASGCTSVHQAPEKLPGHPKASVAIFQPRPTSLGTLLPVAAGAVSEDTAVIACSSAAVHHPRCEACYFVRRGNISYVYCRVNPRHKQRQGPKHKQGTVQRPTAGFTHWSTRGVSWT